MMIWLSNHVMQVPLSFPKKIFDKYTMYSKWWWLGIYVILNMWYRYLLHLKFISFSLLKSFFGLVDPVK